MAGVVYANTASFTSLTPGSGAAVRMPATPNVTCIVYDKYGILPGNWSMSFDGNVVPAQVVSWYKGYGYTKFKVGYQVPSALSLGSHLVHMYTRDQARGRSTFDWSFNVVDLTAPVTTSDWVPNYDSPAVINLTATDSGSGVAHTYYKLDGGAQTEGTVISVSAGGFHGLQFWSVDNSGNIEIPQTVYFNVAPVSSHALPVNSCTAAGCHDTKDLASIHLPTGTCTMCHGPGITPSSNCAASACHGTNPPHHTADTHPVITSVPAPGGQSCTQSTCHGTTPVVTLHNGNCALCHDSPDPVVLAAVASGNATCESCHTASFATVHAAGNASHQVPMQACFSAKCHASTDVSVIHTGGDDPPGCSVCHVDGGAASTVTCASCHTQAQQDAQHGFTHVDASGLPAVQNSSACTACHGIDLPAVHNQVGCVCHTASFLSAEMGPLLTANKAQCIDCHKDAHAAHGFDSSTTTPTASGHNTRTYGTVGAFTMWDGSQGLAVKDSTGATITQEWPLPTANVFWSQVDHTKSSATTDAAPATANTTVGWDSVITCQDCHTNLDSSMGPQGANAGDVGLDPNYPDDWTTAEITSFDPTGMRSVATTAGSPNPYYPRLATYVTDGTFATVANSNPPTYTIVATAPAGANMVSAGKGAVLPGIGPSSPASQTTFYKIYVPGADDASATASNGYSNGDIPGKFICQKCHKLVNPYQGIPAADGNSHGGRGNNLNYIGYSNEIHMEHHGNAITGVADCVSCHVAIPHGWRRPRLLVYESDSAPYKVDLPPVPAGVTSAFSKPSGSTHLDGVDAAATATKDLTPGNAPDFASNDTTNGTSYGNWSTTALGTGWNADPVIGTAVQNNCNACSKTGTTHTPAGEGFPIGYPAWK
jgi:hypothetical protein